MKLYIYLLFSLCLFPTYTSAQEQASTNDSTKVTLPSMAELYYAENSYLSHDYRYELLNKKRLYEKKSKSMNMIGYIGFMGGVLAYTFLAIDKGWISDDFSWSDIGYIMIGEVCAAAIAAPFFIVGHKYKKKAQAIDISTSYMFEIDNGKVQFGPSMMRINDDLCHQTQTSFGISVKTTF